MQNNVVAGTAARIAAYTLDPFNPIPISVTHNHPANGTEYMTKFSRGLIGDELVARFPGVRNMYVSDVDKGNLMLFDESMPSTILTTEKTRNPYDDYEIIILKDGKLPKVSP